MGPGGGRPGRGSRGPGAAHPGEWVSTQGQRPRGPGLSDRLFRNDLDERPDGTRTLRFTDVTRESRIEAHGYGMGVTAGDVDNDGWVDLYLTKFDATNQLLHNNGDGTFTIKDTFASSFGELAIGDFTGDGNVDVVGNVGNDLALIVLPTDGAGDFLSPVVLPVTGLTGTRSLPLLSFTQSVLRSQEGTTCCGSAPTRKCPTVL